MSTGQVARDQQEVLYHREKMTLLDHRWNTAHDRYVQARREHDLEKRAIALEELRMIDSIRESHDERVNAIIKPKG